MFKYLFFGLVIIILIFPLQASAQERGFLGGPIVPCTDNCTLCDIFVLAKNIINFLFELTLVIAPIFVLIGGGTILLSAGSPAKIDLGKRIILSTVIGIVIALVSWTALNMLFNNFIAPNVAPWPWNNPDCEGGGITPPPPSPPPEEDRCDEMSSPGLCFSNNYYCQRGIRDQESDASSELRSLLNCMASRLPTSNTVRTISSISDNSGGRCFANWNGQCPIGVDSCTGTCCAHIETSYHYGITNCRGRSYAVDFADEQSESFIRNAANNCATDLGLGRLNILNEGDHIHIGLRGVIERLGCR